MKALALEPDTQSFQCPVTLPSNLRQVSELVIPLAHSSPLCLEATFFLRPFPTTLHQTAVSPAPKFLLSFIFHLGT